MARDIRAGRGFFELFLQDKDFVTGLDKSLRKLRNVGSRVANIGKAVAGFGLAVTAPLAVATARFAGFGDAISLVGALTKAAGGDVKVFEAEALRLGRTTSFTATQVAAAMGELARAGFEPTGIIDSTGAVLDLARATDTELAEAATFAAAGLRGFGLESAEMGRVADVMSKAVSSSSQGLVDFGEALKPAAPIAAEAGSSIEDLASAIGVLADSQIKGSLAGNQLSRIYKELSKTIDGITIGSETIAVVDSDKNLRPVAQILDEIGRATDELGSGERLRVFDDLFGRAAASALKLAGSTERYAELSSAINESAGFARETAKAMDDNLGGAFRVLGSAIEGTAFAIVGTFEPALRVILRSGTGILGTITEWVQANRGLVASIAAGAAATVIFGGTLIATGVAIKLTAFALSGFVAVFGLATAAVTAFVSPAGLALAAMVALGVGLVRYSNLGSEAIQFLKDRLPELKGEMETVVNAITAALGRGDIRAAAKVMWAALALEWARGAGALKDVQDKLVRQLAEDFVEDYEDMQEGQLTALTEMRVQWARFSGTIESIWGTTIDKVVSVWSEGVRLIAKGMALVRDAFDFNFSFNLEQAFKAINQDFDERARELKEKGDDRRGDIRSRIKTEAEALRFAQEQIAEGIREESQQITNQLLAVNRADELEKETKLRRLEAELAAAIRAAEDQAGQAAPQLDDPQGRKFQDKLDEMLNNLAAAAEFGAQQAQQVLGGGGATFSSIPELLFGTGDVQKKQLKAQEKNEKNTFQILRQMKDAEGNVILLG